MTSSRELLRFHQKLKVLFYQIFFGSDRSSRRDNGVFKLFTEFNRVWRLLRCLERKAFSESLRERGLKRELERKRALKSVQE